MLNTDPETTLHSDTAQAYGNEEEAGKALKESGLSRADVYITTKFSGRADIPTSIQDSLNNVGGALKLLNQLIITSIARS